MEMKEEKLVGLSRDEVLERQHQFGKNEIVAVRKQGFVRKVLHILGEPMFLLLLAASVIYFVLGEPRDGAVMLVFVVGIISIDVIQEWKTDKTLNALRDLSAPRVLVIRDGVEVVIASSDLVPGDLMKICEGVKIPADGSVIRCNDLCVDESTLTGEAEGVWKKCCSESNEDGEYWRKDYCYAGTLVAQGTAVVLVDKIGANTEYGKIGVNVASAKEEATPLQKQTRGLVRLCAVIAAVLFVLVGIVTFLNIPDHKIGERLIESVLAGITLAMAMIPEEFPVILTVFLSMGAWRLARKNSLVRKLPSVETLGAVSVLCVDKTGTITMNQMTVQELWQENGTEEELCEVMGLGCETEAYDPMEKAMLVYCERVGISKEELFSGTLVTEYAFTNELKMMGHVWKRKDGIVIAAKGSPERILTLCELSVEQRETIEAKMEEFSRKALRVIAVGKMKVGTEDEVPGCLLDCKLEFCGLVGLADPPRESVKRDIATCKKAGVRVVMITGDNGITASSIAKQIGMPHAECIITGDMLNVMTEEELQEKVKEVSIFSRVIPEHKMRIVKAFQKNGEVVAMTGDGVNDAPALKYADIGIAMGKRGSEVSREAADLILMDDNFSTIVETIQDGRRIYDNIRKAVGYIFTIHVPIAFSSLLAPILGVTPSSLFLLPLHVVLLELLIDPTCSIVLERQPAETDIMERKPRNPKESILTAAGLTKSLLQGVVIFAAAFGTYYLMLNRMPDCPEIARSMGLVIVMIANVTLVQVNSSEHEFVYQSFRKLVKDKVMWMASIGTIVMLLLILYTPLHTFLKLSALSALRLFVAIGIGVISVIWYELVKMVKRVRNT